MSSHRQHIHPNPRDRNETPGPSCSISLAGSWMSSENSNKEVPIFEIDDSTNAREACSSPHFDFGSRRHYSASASSILTQTPPFA